MSFLKTYWRFLFALAVALLLAVRSFVDGPNLTVSDLAKALAVSLAAILGLQLAESFDISARLKQFRADISADMKSTLNASDLRAVRLVEFRKQADYEDLFDGLTGHLYSYNPHQFAHQSASLNEEAIVRSMQKRYESSDFSEAQFLLCAADGYGQANVGRFAIRLKKVASQRSLANIRAKVKVKVSTKPFPSETTFHLQTKDRLRVVAELRLSGLTVPSSHRPRHYLVTTEPTVVARFVDYFEQEWAHGIVVDVDALLAAAASSTDPFEVYEKILAKHQKLPAITPSPS